MARSCPSHPTFASSKRRNRSKQSRVQIYKLSRKKWEENYEEKDMELMNLKLYLENQSIIEENEKLRKKASLLHQENLVLMSEYQKKFPHLDRFRPPFYFFFNNNTGDMKLEKKLSCLHP